MCRKRAPGVFHFWQRGLIRPCVLLWTLFTVFVCFLTGEEDRERNLAGAVENVRAREADVGRAEKNKLLPENLLNVFSDRAFQSLLLISVTLRGYSWKFIYETRTFLLLFYYFLSSLFVKVVLLKVDKWTCLAFFNNKKLKNQDKTSIIMIFSSLHLCRCPTGHLCIPCIHRAWGICISQLILCVVQLVMPVETTWAI